MSTFVRPANASPSQRSYRLRRDSYGWLAGIGHRPLRRGTILTGRLLRSNDVYQRLIVATDEGVLSINAEDVETL